MPHDESRLADQRVQTGRAPAARRETLARMLPICLLATLLSGCTSTTARPPVKSAPLFRTAQTEIETRNTDELRQLLDDRQLAVAVRPVGLTPDSAGWSFYPAQIGQAIVRQPADMVLFHADGRVVLGRNSAWGPGLKIGFHQLMGDGQLPQLEEAVLPSDLEIAYVSGYREPLRIARGRDLPAPRWTGPQSLFFPTQPQGAMEYSAATGAWRLIDDGRPPEPPASPWSSRLSTRGIAYRSLLVSPSGKWAAALRQGERRIWLYRLGEEGRLQRSAIELPQIENIELADWSFDERLFTASITYPQAVEWTGLLDWRRKQVPLIVDAETLTVYQIADQDTLGPPQLARYLPAGFAPAEGQE